MVRPPRSDETIEADRLATQAIDRLAEPWNDQTKPGAGVEPKRALIPLAGDAIESIGDEAQTFQDERNRLIFWGMVMAFAAFVVWLIAEGKLPIHFGIGGQ